MVESVDNVYLLCDSGGVEVFSGGGEAAELFFDIRAQESDGGQSDVCVIEVHLDLIRVLCVTDGDRGGKKTGITNFDVRLDEGKQYSHRYDEYEGTVGVTVRTLTLDTLSRSSRLMTSYKRSVVHRGWFCSQSL